MTVLFVTNIPAPYRIDFFTELGKHCDLSVIFEAEKAPGTNNKIHDDWYARNTNSNFKAVFLKKGEIQEKRFNLDIIQYLRSEYDVIILSNYSYYTELLALVYLKARRTKYMLEVDGGILRQESGVRKYIKSFLIRGADVYISPSVLTDEFLIHYGAEKEKICRYYFSSFYEKDMLDSPPTIIQKSEIRGNLGIKEKRIILSIGQFIHRKGYDVLLNACCRLSKDVGIYILGGIPTDEYLELQEKFGLSNVHFLDFLDKKSISDYYRAADIFVLPTREDIWGLVISEAMARGLPIITTSNCIAGIELVEEGVNGYIVPVEDANAISDKINIILYNDELREKMCINSLKKIKPYTIENMAREHLAIFREAKNGGHNATNN